MRRHASPGFLAAGVICLARGGSGPFGSRRKPRQKHNLAAKPSRVDADMNVPCGSEREAINDYGPDASVTEHLKQGRHISLELLRVVLPPDRNAVKHSGASAGQ